MNSGISRLSLVVLSAICASVPLRGAAAPITLERLEASVNSAIILRSDVKKFRDTLALRGQLDPLFSGTSIAAKGDKAPDTEIVDFLINEQIILQQFPIADPEVEQEINSIQASNRMDRSTLKSALQAQGFSYQEYFDLIRVSAAKRNLIDRDIRTKVTISDDDIKNYFYNHYARQSSAPTGYKLKIIVVSPKSYKTPAAARETAERALESVRAGESFAEVAKRVSDGPNAATGGDLGEISSDQLNTAFKAPLSKMKIGDVSGVLGDAKSQFFILKLEDIRSQESDRLAKLKDEIRGQLAASEYQHQIGLWLERQRQLAFIHRAGQAFVAEVPTLAK